VRASLEVADIFRAAGPCLSGAHAGHLSLHQLKVMSAIEHCRTAALGGHVEACDRLRALADRLQLLPQPALPQVPGRSGAHWLAAREADLLPVGYFHVVFTLPAEVADIAFHNKALVYDLLFKAASETMLTIAADPKHLGARIGITAVLHTWGSAMTHHPHVHMIVPGGGIAPDGTRWISSRPPSCCRCACSASCSAGCSSPGCWRCTTPASSPSSAPRPSRRPPRVPAPPLAVRKKRWVVYAKPPFAGPEAVLAYLSRYTHRVAISNRRLIAFDETGVTFRYKDYRRAAPTGSRS
jgi:hypothetical protein